MAYIPDITERFPEGYGGVDMTDRFQIGPYGSTDRLIYERSMEEASKVPLDDFKHFKDPGFDRDGFHFNIESSWDGDTYSYSLYLNGDCRLRSYEPITDKDIDFAIKSFLKEYPEAKEWYSYKHAQGTKLLEKWCDNENVPKDFLEIVEDSYEFENGLLLIVYEDKEHEIEKEHICIDLDHLADYEDFSMIQNDFAKYKRSSPEIRLRVIGDPDLAQMLAKSTLAWDEIESIGRILFDKDYIDKYPSSEKAVYGGGLSESELYNLAYRLSGGVTSENDSKLCFDRDLSMGLIGWIRSFDEHGTGSAPGLCDFDIEPVSGGFKVSCGCVSRELSFENVSLAYMNLFKEQYNHQAEEPVFYRGRSR